MKLLVVGATGLVGRNVLDCALADSRIASVVALARRALPPHPKLQAVEVDFDHLPAEAPWWQADAVICALGTTMRTAGSREAFKRVDYEYPLAVARLARQHGTPAYVLNSSVGADPSSRIFYTQVKGEVERDLTRLNFPSLTIARPGFIGGHRDEFRLYERLMLGALTVFGFMLPLRWRVNPAPTIARAMIDAAVRAEPGIRIIQSYSMIRGS
ncbi:NAD(P)H-binding protein [Steroidobacter cummioxidans]|uniref:NAD(P)H-binding protein n=1 Tax=Steroidobacter cummioxidans TaxID=1803913 RepID=UPI000E310FB2|nr:NAD(P)H-binding protein [Steroidobacter cummioxidans]